MGKAMDFNKLRKRRQRTQTIKRVMVLGAVALVFVGIASLNRLLVETTTTASLSDLAGSFGGSGYPIPLPGGSIRDVKSIGGNLAILNDTNLYIYNKNGKPLLSLQQTGDNAVLSTSSTRALLFDMGRSRFSVNSSTKQLYVGELAHGALNGAINRNGDFVIVHASKQYMAEAVVYNSKHQEVGTWSFPDMISHVDIAPSGRMMAVGQLDGDGGQLQSSVVLYRFDSVSPLSKVDLPLGQLMQKVFFLDDDRIGILTDQEYWVITANGSMRHSYRFPGNLLAMEQQGRELLMLFGQPESRIQQLVLLGRDCEQLASVELEQKVLDMALAKSGVYLLNQTGIVEYSRSLEPLDKLEQRNISEIVLVGSKLYYLTTEEICLWGAQPRSKSREDSEAGDRQQESSTVPRAPKEEQEEQQSQQEMPPAGEPIADDEAPGEAEQDAAPQQQPSQS